LPSLPGVSYGTATNQVASEIVNLAFGLLLGALAVAVALAFGLGSRDLAAGQVRELLDSFKQQGNKPRLAQLLARI